MGVKVSPTILVICATAIIIVLVGSYTRLTLTHVDTGMFLSYIAQFLPGTILGVASLVKVGNVENKVGDVKTEVSTVKQSIEDKEVKQ